MENIYMHMGIILGSMSEFKARNKENPHYQVILELEQVLMKFYRVSYERDAPA